MTWSGPVRWNLHLVYEGRLVFIQRSKIAAISLERHSLD